jgi:D-sedoheptulose 7-phosphate isomerase
MKSQSVEDIAQAIITRRDHGGNVFICGNGGSASTAEHFTNDLFSKGVKAYCLSSNTAIITMIANDFGYEHIFSKQLEVYSFVSDLLIVFSCSGESKNIVNAIKYGLETITIFGNEDLTYQENENEHLRVAHEISDGIEGR